MNITASKPSRKKPKGRTFQCSGYPDCRMTFTRSEHLARHIRKHTGERPFECVQCARKFSRLDNLRQHKQTVHAHESNGPDSKEMMKPLPQSPLNGSFPGQMIHMGQEYPPHHQQPLQPQYHHQPPPQQHHQPPPPQQQPQQPQQPQQHLPPRMKQEYAQHLLTKPLPPPPPAKDIVQQQGSNLPASQTLVRPSQFRSKHRPRPLDLPTSRSTVYNDAPFTVPTPRSAGTNFFVLSPVTVQNGLQQALPTSSLPGVQFLANGSKHDSMVSPYNSSFSSVPSTNNTPINSHFDLLTTPTNTSFGGSISDQRSSMYSDHLRDSTGYSIGNGSNRRSWLNNVLNNNYDSSTSPSSSISIPSPNNHLLAQNKENESNDKKLRIESLLNGGGVSTVNEPADKVKLPHVDKLGI